LNIKIAFSDRIGPDIILTHWILYFKTLTSVWAKNNLGYFGNKSEIRPFVTIVGGKNIFIRDNVTLHSGTQLHAPSKRGKAKIVIEDDVLIAPNVFITTNNHNYNNPNIPIRLQGGVSKDVILKKGCWIATNVVILPGVTIGKNSVVAAGAVVTRDVPDYCIVAGIPAKVIKEIKN
jgi:acetyltransferase-like isoleucine patch superfamily enzyme